MYIESVEFLDFRNYPRLLLHPAPTLNILTGPNAQGKTNLLEGLGVLLVGRSIRGAKPADIARWTTACAIVQGEVSQGGSTRRLRRICAPREDGAWAMTGEGCAWARAIPFAWTDLAIVTGGPQARRDFVDGFVAKTYPPYAATYRRYRQVLARRNHLLQRSDGDASVAGRLEPWNEQLVEVGLEVTARRKQGVDLLRAELPRVYPMLGGRGVIDLEYQPSLGADVAREAFGRMLESRLRDELRRGQTLVGPHRDDVAITVNGHDLRTFGSRGQQRLLALTLRLAEVQPVGDAVGSAPVLLLDDALSELDQGVQRQVLEYVSRIGQVFLTTAETGLPDAGEPQWWEVKGAVVSSINVAVAAGAA